MCGIVGAVSPRNVVPVLIDGIRRLEYRGYDSSGLAIIGSGEPRLERLVSTARVADLAARAEATHLDGHTGTTTHARRRARLHSSTHLGTSFQSGASRDGPPSSGSWNARPNTLQRISAVAVISRAR